MSLKNKEINRSILFILFAIIFISVVMGDIIGSFYNETNPFNIMLSPNINITKYIQVPKYAYFKNITLDITLIQNKFNNSIYNSTLYYRFEGNGNDSNNLYNLELDSTISMPFDNITVIEGNTSMYFDGTTKYNQFNFIKLSGNYSMSFWIYINGTSHGTEYIYNQGSANFEQSCNIQPINRIRCTVGNGTISKINQTTTSLNANTWYNIVMAVGDGQGQTGSLDIYVNGLFNATIPVSSILSNSNFMEIGARLGSLYLSNVSLDSFQFFNGTKLSQTNVTNLYNEYVQSTNLTVYISDKKDITRTVNISSTITYPLNTSQATNILKNNCACLNCTNISTNTCGLPLTFSVNSTSILNINLSNATMYTNLTINIFDVEKDTLITNNVEVVIRDFGNYTTTTGIINIDNFTTDAGPHLFTASSSGYVTNQKEVTFTDQQSTNVNMYLINSTSTNIGNLIVEVYDEFYNFIVGANVKLLEYDGTNFIEVSQCFTNTNGECIFNVELNTKFYIVQATFIQGDNVLFAQSTENGELIKIDNTIIELHLRTSEIFTLEDLYDLIIVPSNTELVGNTSFLTAYFFDYSNDNHTVCIDYLLERGLNDLVLNSSCVTGSTGIVNYAGGYLLNRDFTYLAQIYVTADSKKTIYNEYRYEALSGTLLTEFGIWLKPILLTLILSLLAVSLYLKNINIFAIGTIVLSLMTPVFYPNLIGGVTMTFIILLDICIMYLAHKKQALQ